MALINRIRVFVTHPKSIEPYFNEKIFGIPGNSQHHCINEKDVLSNVKGQNILDCACGLGRWGFLLKKQGFSSIGFDMNKEYLLAAKRHKSYHGLIIADLRHIPFKDSSFDTILSIEAIEHLNKKDGEVFLNEMKRLTAQRIVLSTPSGFFKSACNKEGEIHYSGWEEHDFKKLGFSCYLKQGSPYDWLLCIFHKPLSEKLGS